MIKEIYIDNYRCLKDFTITLEQFQLWLGDNGTGKSTVLSALTDIREFINGKSENEVFSIHSLNARELEKDVVSFRISISDGDDIFLYKLDINISRNNLGPFIQYEGLSVNGNNVCELSISNSLIVRIYVNERGEKVEITPFSGSIIKHIRDIGELIPVIRFYKIISDLIIVHPLPQLVTPDIELNSYRIDGFSENFASWRNMIIEDNPSIITKTNKALSGIIPFFKGLKAEKITRSIAMLTSYEEKVEIKLYALFEENGNTIKFLIDQLSDGQIKLIVLYTLLEYVRGVKNCILLIDEPDNFISVREIDPWLKEAEDICADGDQQIILVSHHPEIINNLVSRNERQFVFDKEGKIGVKTFTPVEGLTPSETLARGWDNE